MYIYSLQCHFIYLLTCTCIFLTTTIYSLLVNMHFPLSCVLKLYIKGKIYGYNVCTCILFLFSTTVVTIFIFSLHTFILGSVLPFKLMEIPHVKASVCKITGNRNIWHYIFVLRKNYHGKKASMIMVFSYQMHSATHRTLKNIGIFSCYEEFSHK